MNALSLGRKATAMLAVTAMLALAPVAGHAGDKKKKQQVDPAKLVWPSAPEPGRIRWVGEYHGIDIKGVKKQGLLERLAGVEQAIEKDMLTKPIGVAVDSKGRIFVTDSMQSLVFVFDLEKKTLTYLGDKPPAKFQKPIGVTVDAQDRVFVSDAGTRAVTVFSPEGEVVTIFGEDDLSRPAGMAVDNELNRLYVADVKEKKVAVFDLTTLKLDHWVGKSWKEKLEAGDEERVLNAPVSLALDPDGQLYVVDSFLDRVTVFDTDGEYVRHIGTLGKGPGKFMRPRGVAIDVDGHVYVTDGMAHNFQVLNPDGRPLLPIGALGNGPANFIVPAAIVVDRFNRIIVADQGNSRIQVFRYVPEAEAGKKSPAQTETASKGKK